MKAEVDINKAENRKIGSQKNEILFFWKKKIKRDEPLRNLTLKGHKEQIYNIRWQERSNYSQKVLKIRGLLCIPICK